MADLSSLDAIRSQCELQSSPADPLARHVDGPCWVWQGRKQSSGYGQTRWRGRYVLVHRFAYLLAGGTIVSGAECDHLCRVRDCVNPAHIEAVTKAENIRRGKSGSSLSREGACPVCGSREMYTRGTRRECAPCKRAVSARNHERKRRERTSERRAA